MAGSLFSYQSLLSSIAAISLTLLSALFFSRSQRGASSLVPHQRSLLSQLSCSSLYSSNGIVNYLSLHHCFFRDNFFISMPLMLLFILLYFYVLIKTAQSHFSVVTAKLTHHLNLSPSVGGVTLLALGNGAPDVFASLAAVRSGYYKTGFGAILSAGAFVSAFVVGFVAIYAAPFRVDPVCFVRDVVFYLTGVSFLFYVYLSGEIFVWQSIGFVGFYVFFVGFVLWMDFGIVKRWKAESCRTSNEEMGGLIVVESIIETFDTPKHHLGLFKKPRWKISQLWEVPIVMVLKLTIPQSAPSQWNRFYLSANIALCPLALLCACSSLVSPNHAIPFIFSGAQFPLWLVVLSASSSLAVLHFALEREPPGAEQVVVVLAGFVMSVFWISTAAGELLSCLVSLGKLLEVPQSLLGLTVLAWGNSVGDLVADVAVARAGHPAMAMAGCFAGPMFNMLVGLGSALAVQTAALYPKPYQLRFNTRIVVAFVFLLLSLMGSLLVLTWFRFRVPRPWGFCLVALYLLFMIVSLFISDPDLSG